MVPGENIYMSNLLTPKHKAQGTSLRDRVALVTGASRGIGAAVAARYASEGAQVILVARDEKGLAATEASIRAAGGAASTMPLDLAGSADIGKLARDIAQKFGRLDILVGNAAL